MSLSLLFDLVAPALNASSQRPHLDSRQVARQLAFNVAVGAVL